jgi:transglutaminase superfamily protein
MSRLARLRLLSWPERRTLLGALAALPAIALALRLLGLRRVQTALAWLAPAARDATALDARADVGSIARIVDVAARHGPWKARCLPRSLALQWLLRRRGIETALRVGVRKTSGAIEAHAWLEHRGAPLIDDRGVHGLYAAFDEVVRGAPEATK